MEGNHYLDTNELIKWLRGDTSEPLRNELLRTLSSLLEGQENVCAFQAPSTIARNGLSVIIHKVNENLTISIYYARAEIPGYLSHSKLAVIKNAKWEITGDYLGLAFACVWKIYSNLHISLVAQEMVIVLETLGLPRRKNWDLAPAYGVFANGLHHFEGLG